jgi:type I restriction enzyme S subunit
LGYCYSGLTGKSGKDFGAGKARYITFLNVLSNIVIDPSMLENVRIDDNEAQNNVIKDDLFFNTSSETPEEVGMCATLLHKLPNTYLNSFCFGFRLYDNSMDSLFLSYLFNSNVGRKKMSVLAQGATRYNLSKSYFCETMIFVPLYAEQSAIAVILSDMDAEISALAAKLNKAKLIKQGMMQELLTGRIRLVKPTVVAVPVTKVAEKNSHGYSEGYEDAVILVALVNSFGTEQHPFTAFDCQKFPYLFHRHIEGVAKGYKKFAAGPYNPSLKYSTARPIALGKKYIRECMGFYKGFVIDENAGEALGYFEKWHGEEPLKWLEQFRYIKNRRDELELLTTVDMAMVELRNNKKPIIVSAVKEIIQNSDEWKAKLKREIFSDKNITRAIAWSIKLFGEGE